MAPPAPTDVIETIECATAAQLLDALSPRSGFWPSGPDAWIFRGQSDDWPLKAKAHRDGPWFEQLGMPVGTLNPNDTELFLHELRVNQLLVEFSREVDRAGLAVPHPAPQLFPQNSSKFGNEPGRAALPTLALAQHHGLPTPWLDWSTQPRAAAYFACAGRAWKDAEPAGTMVVWALRRDFVELTLADDKDGRDEVDGVYLTLEFAPRADNGRLHAQAGLFTWLHGEKAHEKTIDGHVLGLAERWETSLPKNGGVALPLMRCFRLPSSEAPQLLELLSDENVTAATIFPGYDGVVQTLKERAWCDARLRSHT